MRVSRWLDNSLTWHWNQPIIYQKTRELAVYQLHNLWSLLTLGLWAAVAAVSVLAVCGRPAESGSKRADRKEHANFATWTNCAPKFGGNSRNQSFSNANTLNVTEACEQQSCVESAFRTTLELQFHTRLFENNRFRKFVSTDRFPSELNLLNQLLAKFHTLFVW